MTERTGDHMTDQMTDLIAVYTTVANDQQAQRLASAAIQSSLAACVQTEAIRSTYRWQGQVECQEEIRVLLKQLARPTANWRSYWLNSIPMNSQPSSAYQSGMLLRPTPNGCRAHARDQNPSASSSQWELASPLNKRII